MKARPGATVPDDLAQALDSSPKAEQFVAMLGRGETIYPVTKK